MSMYKRVVSLKKVNYEYIYIYLNILNLFKDST